MEEIKNNPGGGHGDRKARCVCTWKTPMCCEVWKKAYKKAAEQMMKERVKQKEKEKEMKEKAAAGVVKAKMPALAGEARLIKQGR